MAEIDIFISYKSERRKAAEHLAAVLELYGYSVWFDYELVKGSDFGFQIDRRIREAKTLVALWCSLSVGSRWVAEEADLAHKLGILIPAMIEPCEPQIGLRRLDYIDLTSWDGSPRGYLLDPLIRELSNRIGRSPTLDIGALWKYEETWRRFGSPPLKAFALGTPLATTEGDRRMPHTGTVPQPTTPVLIGHPHELMALAAQEWPAVRDNADPTRLERFERYFAGTFHAEEARVLREKLEAGSKRTPKDRTAAGGAVPFRERRKAEKAAALQAAASNGVEVTTMEIVARSETAFPPGPTSPARERKRERDRLRLREKRATVEGPGGP
jgi:TIR domain